MKDGHLVRRSKSSIQCLNSVLQGEQRGTAEARASEENAGVRNIWDSSKHGAVDTVDPTRTEWLFRHDTQSQGRRRHRVCLYPRRGQDKVRTARGQEEGSMKDLPAPISSNVLSRSFNIHSS
jgi:hypothetical protein